jgi:hypothetical protein
MNQDFTSTMYQVAIITLADGRQGVFTGSPLVLEPGSVAVATVQFTEPQPLPEGYGLANVALGDAYDDEAVTVDEGPSDEVGA